MRTRYSLKDLRKINENAFRAIAGDYLRGCVVGGEWLIESRDGQTVLITKYTIKDLDGTWIDKEKETVL
jgi:hypothetical protein